MPRLEEITRDTRADTETRNTEREPTTTMERGSAIVLWQIAWSLQEHCLSTKIFTRQHGYQQTGE